MSAVGKVRRMRRTRCQRLAAGASRYHDLKAVVAEAGMLRSAVDICPPSSAAAHSPSRAVSCDHLPAL
jgi:hypothetical protein